MYQHPSMHASATSEGDLPTEGGDAELHDPSHVEPLESREQQLQLDAPHHLEHHAKEGLSFPIEVDKDQMSTLEEQLGPSALVVTTEATTNEGEQALIVDISPVTTSQLEITYFLNLFFRVALINSY